MPHTINPIQRRLCSTCDGRGCAECDGRGLVLVAPIRIGLTKGVAQEPLPTLVYREPDAGGWDEGLFVIASWADARRAAEECGLDLPRGWA